MKSRVYQFFHRFNLYPKKNLHGEKKFVVLTNQIVYIELTKLFCFPNKFSVNLFVAPTKEFVIAFCLTKLFVKRTKILLRSLLEIIDWTRLDSIDPIENDKESRFETIKFIDFYRVS